MPARLLLIRHAQTEHNLALRLAGWTDSPLSPEGRRQAERLASHLAATETLDAIYASPLQRARDTAAAIARRFGLTVRLRDDLREIHFGRCESLTLDEVRTRFPDLWARLPNDADLTLAWPGGESRAAFYDRIRRAVAAISAAHPAATVAVVTHGGVISALLADLAEGAPWRWARYLVNNCSISEVEIGRAGHRLVRCNVDGLARAE